jgi:phosphate transport system substrate-binding protein
VNRRSVVSRSVVLLVLFAIGGSTIEPASGQVKVDPKLPEYKPVAGVSGTLKSIGSDSMNNLMAFWGEGFRRHYPGVRIEVEGKGSSTAPPALIAGTAQLGPMSRNMKDAEIASFKQKFGYEPTEMRMAVDALAVFVNKDNPVESLTLPEIDAIFSRTRRLGHAPVTTWGQVGVEGSLAKQPISLYGRNAASGTYGFFKEEVLGDGDYSSDVKQQPGSSAVVSGVAGDDAGIGYSGIGYKTSDVKAIAIAKNADSDPVEANEENVYNQKYPLFRFLYVYVNARPGAPLDPLRREFVKYVFSKDGQEAVVKDGYFPVPAALATRELKKVGIELEPAK